MPVDGGVSAWRRPIDPVPIAAYIGSGSTFNEAIVSFGERYADQAAADRQAFVEAYGG